MDIINDVLAVGNNTLSRVQQPELGCWVLAPGRPTPGRVPSAMCKWKEAGTGAERISAAASSLGTWCLADDPDLDVFCLCPGMGRVRPGAERSGLVLRGQGCVCPPSKPRASQPSRSRRVRHSELCCCSVPLAAEERVAPTLPSEAESLIPR